ncbi:DUF5991 domain-containing protein [Tenacibaculum ovolyticum]|uniref:DUF5991 domain-containing protein n=1 Tax=Tenacibaculum ovolyticum TaxID=104270 RepID=UPI0012DC7F1D|nr:DUF5991 domain-containing protein [Tenacibaculum ovolyticum]
MKKIISYIILIFIFFGCKNKSDLSQKVIIQSNDTIMINHKECVIDIKFDIQKMNDLKNKYGDEDFYVIADDANFYTAEVNDFLKKKGKKIIYVKMKPNTILGFNNKYYMSYADIAYWDYILFKETKKPKVISPINFESAFKKFFYKKTYIEEIDEKWFGKYNFFQDLGKINDIGAFIDYNIRIEKDDCFFSGQGYQTNFYDLCYAKQNKDTLDIYYKKTIEGTDYNKSDNPIAKIFKKDNKYFVISSAIKDVPVLLTKE